MLVPVVSRAPRASGTRPWPGGELSVPSRSAAGRHPDRLVLRYSKAEGTSSTKFAVVRVLRTLGSQGVLQCDLSTSDGTAKAGDDYTALSDFTLTFSDGVTSVEQLIQINRDGDVEGDETFTATLSNAREGGACGGSCRTGAIASPGTTTITITNDD